MLFFVLVTSTKHYWIISAERRRREAFVLSRRQKHVVNVPISAAFFRSDRMHKCLDICVRENSGCLAVSNYRVCPHRIAPGYASVLVKQMDEIAVCQVIQESFRIPPAAGDEDAVTVWDQVNGMRFRRRNHWAAQVGQIPRKTEPGAVCDRG